MAIFNGTAGDDEIYGTNNADTIRGFGGNDSLFGERGDDRILGGHGDDFLVGNRGDDTLIGGEGDDWFIGGRGNDTFNGKDTKAENLDGSGFDVVDYFREQGSLGVTVNLATGVAIDTYGQTDKLIDIEAVIGTNLADRLTGGNVGNDGFEDFRGLGGNDTIDGGSGFDRVTYSSDLGAGGTQGVTVNLKTGKAIDGFGDTDTLISIEAVRGTVFADKIIGDGGDNRFEPLGGADYIHGGGGTDRVAYHNDHFFLQNGNGVVGIKADLAKGTIVDTSGVHVDTVVSIENVTGSIFDDVIRGDGKANQLDGRGGDDVLVGRGGNDNLGGGDGDDVLKGGGGDDVLNGGTGNDVLRGGGGNDWLEGGPGDDLLIGGAGSDAHGFVLGAGHDRVRFVDGDDSLGFSGYGYASADDVVALAVQQGNHVVIANGGDSVTLLNFDLANLDASDIFLF